MTPEKRVLAMCAALLLGAALATPGWSLAQQAGTRSGPSGSRNDLGPGHGTGPIVDLASDLQTTQTTTTTTTTTSSTTTAASATTQHPGTRQPQLLPSTTGAGGLPALVGAPDLFLDIGVCGHDAWAQEVAAGLTDGGFNCNAPPSGETARSSGHSNYRSTWVDTRTIAIELIQSLHDQKAMPDIRIGINPNPGVVSVQSWFWVLRSSYANAPIVASGSQSVPWEESWDETTSHEEDVSCDDGSPGPCHRTVTETRPVVVDHTDVITATDTFTPATYTWDFGDGRPGSQQSYPADSGLGLPYTNPNTPSSVAWRYQFDSRDHPDGYPITVIVTWGVGFHVHATSDVAAGNYDMAGAMKPRSERYGTTHIVRQVQSLRVAAVQGVSSP